LSEDVDFKTHSKKGYITFEITKESFYRFSTIIRLKQKLSFKFLYEGKYPKDTNNAHRPIQRKQ